MSEAITDIAAFSIKSRDKNLESEEPSGMTIKSDMLANLRTVKHQTSPLNLILNNGIK